MGTRSLTVVKNEQNKEIFVMYAQYDGYPTGHGQELATWLAQFKMTDGFTEADRNRKSANGMPCLAGQLIAHFKTEIGGYYIYPAKTRDCGEEYIYEISLAKDRNLHLKVFAGSMTFFGLPGTKQKNMPVIWEGDPKDFDGKAAEANHEKLAASIPNDFAESQKS